MTDQAYKLRELISINKKVVKPKVESDARIIAISSGKGGVGKTSFTLNLGIALSKLNKRVTIIDADLGLANIDILMGVIPRYNLGDLIKSEKTLQDIIVEGPNGIQLVSGGSGVMDLVNLKEDELNSLIGCLEELNESSDYILIDTGAGLNNSVLSFIRSAQEVIVVITSDPTSITDAYALVKSIHEVDIDIKVVVNRIDTNKEGHEVFHNINTAANKFLNSELKSIGFIYEDSNVKRALKSQVPFLISFPNSLASKGVELIAYNLNNKGVESQREGGFSKFIKRFFNNKK